MHSKIYLRRWFEERKCHVDKLLVTVPEAAKLLSISRSSCYELIREGVLPVVQLGNIKRIPVAGLVALAEARQEAQ